MKVRLSAEAKARLRAIRAFIAEASPENADRLIDRLLKRAESLDALPFRGREVPEYKHDHIREIPERPYRIIYRIADDEIQIITFLHYRQLLPSELVAFEDD